jgi:hypothetical protein
VGVGLDMRHVIESNAEDVLARPRDWRTESHLAERKDVTVQTIAPVLGRGHDGAGALGRGRTAGDEVEHRGECRFALAGGRQVEEPLAGYHDTQAIAVVVVGKRGQPHLGLPYW